MDNLVAWADVLDNAYNKLPSGKRTCEGNTAMQEIKRMSEHMAGTNATVRKQIAILMVHCEDDLGSILKQYETPLGQSEMPEVKKLKKSGSLTSLNCEGEASKDEETSSSADIAEPTSQYVHGDWDIGLLDVQDKPQDAKLRDVVVNLAQTIQDLEQKQEYHLKKLHDRIAALEHANSRLYVGEVVNRLEDYLELRGGVNSIKKLPDAVSEEFIGPELVKKMAEAAQEQFHDAVLHSPLGAFKAIARKMRHGRNAVAHPNDVHVDDIKKACISREELKLLNVLIAIADNDTFPLRHIAGARY